MLASVLDCTVNSFVVKLLSCPICENWIVSSPISACLITHVPPDDTMLQVNMATMESEIDRLSVIIEKQEDKVQACLEVVDDYYELKRRFNNQ